MSDERSNWQDVLRQVPEATNVASVSTDSAASTRHALTLPQWASPGQLLTALEASVSGRSESKIINVLQSDLDRRLSIARKDANQPKKIAVVTIIILLTVTVGVLFLPSSFTDLDDYFLDVGTPTLITGILGVASLIASVLIERRSSPRSLPYSPFLLIVYTVLFTLGVVVMSLHVSSVGLWIVPGAKVGVVLAGVTAVGYLALYFWVAKRPTLVQAIHGDAPEGREFDEKLREHVAKIVRKRDDFDASTFRSRTLLGIKSLYESGRISRDVAVSMLREIAGKGDERVVPE